MKKSVFAAGLLLIVIFLSILVLQKEPNNYPGSIVFPTPTTLGATAKAGSNSLYPNTALTPGEVFPNITKDQVCTSGYSATVRNVSINTKKQVFAEYGISYPQPQGSYEVDHFISLELGGNNSLNNLWPEPSEPVPGFHQKDIVENFLHKQVCDGIITLTEAQNEIKTDWYKVYLNMNIVN